MVNSMRSKKRILALATVIAVVSVVLSSCSKTVFDAQKYITQTENLTFSKYQDKTFTEVTPTAEQQNLLSGYQQVKQNRFLTLYFCQENAAVAVFDHRSGKLWFSNHPDIATDTVIDPASLGIYQSQLLVNYIDGQNTKRIDSYTYSVSNGAFRYEVTDSGLKVTYPFVETTTEDDKEKTTQLFAFTMVYSLEEESLLVTVPMDQAEYNQNMPPLQLEVLPHFGGCPNSSDGYLLLPDGSGALVDFQEGKYASSNYYGAVYGQDESLNIEEKPLSVKKVAMPVFGVRENNNGFLAIIEDGAALAQISASRAGSLSSYNEVYPMFTTFSSQTIEIGNLETAGKMTGTQSTPYGGTLRTRYAFLDTDESDYSGMAGYYRAYLESTAGLSTQKAADRLPLNLEMIGAIDKLKSTLGIKYTGTVALTSTEDAERILSELLQNNIKNINLRYTGWFNNGLKQELPTSVKVEKAIGGKSGFSSLADFANKNGIGFYPSVDFCTTPSGSSGFNKFNMSARQIDQKEALVYIYDYVSQQGKDSRYVLSASVLSEVIAKFNKAYGKYGVSGVCVDNVASKILADYTKGDTIDREMTVNVYRELLAGLDEQYQSLMLDGGFSYAAPYADVILNTAFESSGFEITDRAVPFYQLVYHGSVIYSGEPLNLSYDYDTAFLKMIEYGGVPYFQLMAADGSAIKNTDYSYYCSNNYNIWKEKMIAAYSEANQALASVQDARMIKHEQLAEGVYQTTYEDGTAVIVNYNDTAYNGNGVTAEAMNWSVRKGSAE